MNPNGVVSQNGSPDLVGNIFGTVNTGIQSYFGYQAAKASAKAVQKTPPASIGLIVGGVVVLGVLLVVLVKH